MTRLILINGTALCWLDLGCIFPKEHINGRLLDLSGNKDPFTGSYPLWDDDISAKQIALWCICACFIASNIYQSCWNQKTFKKNRHAFVYHIKCNWKCTPPTVRNCGPFKSVSLHGGAEKTVCPKPSESVDVEHQPHHIYGNLKIKISTWSWTYQKQSLHSQGDHSGFEFQICQKSVSTVTLATQTGVESGSRMLQLPSIPRSESLDASDWGNGCLGACAVDRSWCLKTFGSAKVLEMDSWSQRYSPNICIYISTWRHRDLQEL